MKSAYGRFIAGRPGVDTIRMDLWEFRVNIPASGTFRVPFHGSRRVYGMSADTLILGDVYIDGIWYANLGVASHTTPPYQDTITGAPTGSHVVTVAPSRHTHG